MLFSQRNGLVPEKVIQRESLDAETRNQLWNLLYTFLHEYGNASDAFKNIWTEHFKQTEDTFSKSIIKIIRDYFMTQPWYTCYDFIEFFFSNEKRWYEQFYFDENGRTKLPFDEGFVFPVVETFNSVLKRESCAYRIINGKVTEITSEPEMVGVATALGCKSRPVSEHLEKALMYLTDRKSPDYANSVKESITAVESLCCTVTGIKKSLGKTLEILKEKEQLHPSLLEAFDKLFGYASNAPGIRHGGDELAKVDQPLAQFILVTSSAFINYVKVTMKLDL